MRNYKKLAGLSLIVVVIILGTVIVDSCKHQPYVLPVALRTGDPSICFERDILPIFQSNCAKSGCHDASSGRSGYVLDSYADVIKKGIVPGNPAASVIWQSVSMNIFNVSHMPRNAPDLSATDLDLIKRWIATGAIDSGACSGSTCDTTKFTYSGTIEPMMQTYCVGCHNTASAPGGSLNDYNSVMTAAVHGRLIGDISHESGYNAMPLVGTMLQDCQITQVKEWVAAGAPDN
jgi:hypothetical protein